MIKLRIDGEAEIESKRLVGLDHLRALAITLVFLYHYGIFPHPEWIRTVGKFGWTGVDLFFVLSGYLISSQLFVSITQGKRISFVDFFIKRFFRIIPAYLFVVALYFMFPILREREAPAPLWKYLTFTQNFGLDLGHQGTFSHAWSLCIEEQFYLLLPLTLITLSYYKLLKKGSVVLLALFMFVWLARIYSWNILVEPFMENDDFGIRWYKWIYYPTYCRLDGLLTGVSIAAVCQFSPQWKKLFQKYANVFLLAGLVILAGAYLVCLEQTTFNASVFGFILVSLGYGFLVFAAVSPGSFLYRFNSRIASVLASLSYAVYLTHKIVIHITQQLFSILNIPKDSDYMFFICLAASLLAAVVLNRLVEKPFLRLRKRVLAGGWV